MKYDDRLDRGVEFDRDIVNKQAREELERALDLVHYIVITCMLVMRLYCTILIHVPTGHLSIFADTIHWCLPWDPTLELAYTTLLLASAEVYIIKTLINEYKIVLSNFVSR